MGDLNGGTWPQEKYGIDRTRRDVATATAEALRAAVNAGLDRALAHIAAHDRQSGAEWLFHQAWGATRVTEALAEGLESGRES